MMGLFAIAKKSGFDLHEFSGFVHPFTEEGGKLVAYSEKGRRKEVPDELKDDLILLKESDFRSVYEDKSAKTAYCYASGGSLFKGGLGFLRRSYENKEIRFPAFSILEETEFVSLVFDRKDYLAFIDRNAKRYEERFKGRDESLRSYMFVRYHLIRFFDGLFQRCASIDEFLLALQNGLKALSEAAGRGIHLRDAGDYVYYLTKHQKISFDKFKDLTFSFLY